VSDLEAARDHFLALHAQLAPGDEPAWLAALRREAKSAFADAGLPSTRLEEWRYTNPAALAKMRFELPHRDASDAFTPDSRQLELGPGARFVFVDGVFAPALSSAPALAGGARVDSLRGLRRGDASSLEGRLGALLPPKQSAFADLNTAFLDDGAVVRAPAGADVTDAVHLVFVSTQARPTATHPRVLVLAERGSRIRLVQDHLALHAEGFCNPVTEVHAGEDSSVDLVLLQREPERRFHVSSLAVRQERASRVGTHTLSLGGGWLRNDASFLLAGEGAECRLHGLYVGGGEQLVDNHTLVDHAVPHCTSDELYKGILGGASRGVFRGRVIVRPHAQKTNAQQHNPNLLIGRKAEIDTKPQLEIYADDVKCSHGSTIGQLSADALFYLRSRGIEQDAARDMLTAAFAASILEALPLPGLADALGDLLRERLRFARLEASG
jgi:Fe-S cluster assembly protein SufD